MNRHLLGRVLLLLAVSLALFGCGGGGGGGAAAGGGSVAVTKAVLTVSIQGTVAPGTSIGAIDVTVNLPSGVTARADAVTGETSPGVVVPSGNGLGSTIAAKYTAATATAPGTIRIGVINSAGAKAGEMLALNLDISGVAPSVSGFGTTGLSVVELNGSALSGMAAALTLQLI